MGICILRIKKPGLGNNGTIAFALFFFVIALYDTRSSIVSRQSQICASVSRKKRFVWGGEVRGKQSTIARYKTVF